MLRSNTTALWGLVLACVVTVALSGGSQGIAQETVLSDAAVTPLPETEFFDDLSSPPSAEAKAKNEAIGSAANHKLAEEAKPIAEIPKDQSKHEADVKKAQDTAMGSAATRLGKHSRAHVAAIERNFLTADHNGSLDPASPWSQGEKATADAQAAAVVDNKIKRNEQAAKQKDAAEKKARAAHQAAKKVKDQTDQARQEAWDKTNAEKRRKAAEAAKKAASQKHYDQRLKKSHSGLFKNDPEQQKEEEKADTHHKHMAKPPKSL
jgi:hypothetical protein